MSSDEIVVAIAIFCFGSAQAVHTMSELMSGLKNAKRSKLCAQGGFDEKPCWCHHFRGASVASIH